MDLGGYGVRELVELRQKIDREQRDQAEQDPERGKLLQQIDDEIRNRHRADPTHTENELTTAAERWGLALAEVLMGVGSDADRRARHPRYQHPYDPHVVWSGMGPKPHWVREWEAGGNSLESLRIRH